MSELRGVIGVDNGLDGALCAVAPTGELLRYTRMPTCERNGKREIDVLGVLAWCNLVEGPFVFAPEEPLKHARTSQAMRSMSISYGKLLALATLSGWDLAPVEVRDWQREMLGKKVPKGHTKIRALAAARELVPEETWVPKGCRSPHDGVVDAYLIARYVAAKK
jgi:hypothetical protein